MLQFPVKVLSGWFSLLQWQASASDDDRFQPIPSLPPADSTTVTPQEEKTMFQKVVRCLVLLVLLPLVAGAFGCAGKYTGGGSIPSAAAGSKAGATFGFNLEGVDGNNDGMIDIAVEYDPVEGFYFGWMVGKGQFNYNDHGAGVRFHADFDASYTSNPNGITDQIYVRFDEHFNITALLFIGTYTSRAGSGVVMVAVTANGDWLDNLDDTIEVTLYGGPYAGYHNSGTVQNGNIQWHPAKSK
jgi:hypothetical protein